MAVTTPTPRGIPVMTMPATMTTRATATPVCRTSPNATTAMTAAMAPSVETIGVTRLMFPLRTASDQNVQPAM